MRKIEGLHFLRRHFPHLCVDCIFVEPSESLDKTLLEAHAGLFRVRTGRKHGSELNLPRRTCASIQEVDRFIQQSRKQDGNLQFVIHRIWETYFAPDFVGTVALFEKPHPELVIQVQACSKELVAQMDAGVRARDWPITAIYRFPYLGIRPDITLVDRGFRLETLARAIWSLWEIGRTIDDLKQATRCSTETVTLFNLYPDGSIILDDHRGTEAFV